MGRINSFFTRVRLLPMFLFDSKMGHIRLMNCQKCGCIFFDTEQLLENSYECYKARYRCRKCGAEIIETQYLTGVIIRK